MRKDLMQSYNLSSDKVLHIRNIIDDNFLDHKATEYIPKEYKKHNFNIVAAGALYSVKGFDILIKSFAKLSVVNSAANLYIIGKERYEKGYREILESLISELNLMGKVHLLGHKNNPYPYIKNANLLVMSSRKEGFPNVVLEALHFCTPVIATDCVDWDGIIVNGINGYVVPREDIHALSDGLIKAINNEFKTSEIELSNFDYNVLFK
jgi:glycosyltransferase involved in cell wall biosynthesis